MSRNLVTALLALSLGTVGCGPEGLMDPSELDEQHQAARNPRDAGTPGSPSETAPRIAKRGGKTTEITPPDLELAPEQVYALRFAHERVDGEEPAWRNEFDVADTYFVEIATDVPASLTGHHTLSVVVREPTAGNVYQRFDVAFAAGVAPDPDEVEAEDTASGYRVWVSLPVKGTFIDNYSLLGTWSVESRIDSGESAVASATFDLN